MLRPSVATVATVARVWPISELGASIALELVQYLDEREAVALAGGVPALYARACATMQLVCPPGVPELRWQQAINDVGLFLDEWGETATAAGWAADDLFGLYPTVPLSRMDRMGLMWLLKGKHVADLAGTTATLEGGLRYYRAIPTEITASSGGSFGSLWPGAGLEPTGGERNRLTVSGERGRLWGVSPPQAYPSLRAGQHE